MRDEEEHNIDLPYMSLQRMLDIIYKKVKPTDEDKIFLENLINFPAKQFECEECNKKFDCKKAVGQHMQDIHIKVGCKFCGRKTFNKSNVKTHQVICHKKATNKVTQEPGKYWCESCKKNFNQNHNLQRHQQQVHENFKLIYI